MSDAPDFEVVASFGSEREARHAVEALTRDGVGAIWQADPPAPGGTGATFSVRVVPGDGAAARRVLGLPDPEGADEPTGRFPDWVYVMAIFLAALVILPLVAFFLSYKLSGG